MRKELLYLGVILVLIMACVTLFFETNHPDAGQEKLPMQSPTFVERMDGGATAESSALRQAQETGDSVLQQSVRAAKSFGENVKRDLLDND